MIYDNVKHMLKGLDSQFFMTTDRKSIQLEKFVKSILKRSGQHSRAILQYGPRYTFPRNQFKHFDFTDLKSFDGIELEHD